MAHFLNKEITNTYEVTCQIIQDSYTVLGF